MERRGWVWTLRGPSGLGVSTLWGSFTLLVTSATQTQARGAGRLLEAGSGPLEQRILGFPGGSGKDSTCQCRRYWRHRFDPWVRKIPYSRKW